MRYIDPPCLLAAACHYLWTASYDWTHGETVLMHFELQLDQSSVCIHELGGEREEREGKKEGKIGTNLALEHKKESLLQRMSTR